MNRKKIISLILVALLSTTTVSTNIIADTKNNTNTNVLTQRALEEESQKITDIDIRASSEQSLSGKEGPAKLAIDNDPSTFWHTAWDGSGEKPHNITMDLKKTYTLDKFEYLPRPDTAYGRNGNITRYTLQASQDGVTFTDVATGIWANNGDLKVVKFTEVVETRYIRLVANETISDVGKVFASAAELNVYGTEAVKEFAIDINVEGGNEVNTDLTITPTVIGQEGNVKYRYEAYLNGKRISLNANEDGTCTWTPTMVGKYYLKVYANDATGKTISKEITYVINNTKFMFGDIAIDGGNKVGTELTINPTVKDSVGMVKYSYEVYHGGNRIPLTSNKWIPTSVGLYYVKVYATDSTGKTIFKEITYNIENLSFNITEVSITGGNEVGNNLTINSTIEGQTGDVTYKYEVYHNGNRKVLNSNEWIPENEGLHYVKVYATDKTGKTVSKQITYEIVNNKFAFGNVTISGGNEVRTTLTINTTVNDATGNVTYMYEVYHNGIRTELDSNQWTPAGVGLHYVKVYATDATGKTVSKQITYEIVNNSFVFGDITISGGNEVGSTLTINPTVNGAYGDVTYRYEVYYNGYRTPLTSSKWVPENAGLHYVKVYATDATGKTVSKEISYSTVKAEVPEWDVDKSTLGSTISYGLEIKNNEELNGVVPIVVQEFEAALAQAQAVFANENSKQSEVTNSFHRLKEVIWMLEFKQGDKTELNATIAIAQGLTEDNYEGDWQQLQAVLSEAISVLNDSNAMQNEVDEANAKLSSLL